MDTSTATTSTGPSAKKSADHLPNDMIDFQIRASDDPTKYSEPLKSKTVRIPQCYDMVSPLKALDEEYQEAKLDYNKRKSNLQDIEHRLRKIPKTTTIRVEKSATTRHTSGWKKTSVKVTSISFINH